MTPLKMAVIGTGALGQHHARILSGDSCVELVAVADTNLSRCREIADRVGTEAVADYRLLLNQVQAAVIAVPTVAHFAVAADFIGQGISVLVEKPLTADLREGEQLVNLAEKTGALLQVGHVERFNPATQVAMKASGPPKYIRAERVSPFSFRSTDIGVVHDLLIHDLDLILHLVRSPVSRVEAFGICILGDSEDSVQARLTFENGAIADITASRVSPVVRRGMQLWSHRGCVDVDFQTRQVVQYRQSEELQYGTSPVIQAREPGANIEQLKRDVFGRFIKVENLAVPEADPLTAELRHFVDCVQQHKPPLVDGRVALRALVVANRILESVRSGAIGSHLRTQPARKLAG
jgi:predicted dehydrogenase